MNDAVTIKQVLDKEGFIIHKIKGGSMLPLLEEKQDMVRLEAVKEKDKLKKYDVPLFFDKKTGTLVLHRIIKVKKDHYITYGDNRKNYEIVPFDSVLAIAVGFYKKDKYIPCDDPEYLKYVKERCSSIRKRKLYLRKREKICTIKASLSENDRSVQTRVDGKVEENQKKFSSDSKLIEITVENDSCM
jgi:signal peptidase I